MAGSDNLVARYQKDLDGWTARYSEQLEKTVGEHAKNLQPTWKRAAEAVQKKAKKLYEEARALDIENGSEAIKEKFNSLTYKSKRLDTLAADMLNDIKLAEAQQQPYFFSALEYEFERGYYFTAFGMEQAAEIAVRTPLLTKHTILGVLVNPWLPDGATYSDRLRANTALLAQKMRAVMSEATTYGWGWNEASRRLDAVTNEGYFNSVRLIRTELNRASNLGTSYMMMENSDILDGKTWDATLDSRTAPKDADNDGKTYDLDYDTPNNPGVPGQRIPNHPHCRCRWRALLSAIGLDEKRKRIARDDTDTPSHFGNRAYTEAKTYRDYAKLRSLPDLDERLAKENPKRYLRPGETLADMNRQVIRYSSGKNTVTIAKPEWERLNTSSVTPKKVPVNRESSVFTKFGETHYNNIHDIVNSAPERPKTVWAKIENRLTVTDPSYKGTANYSYFKGGVSLNIEKVAKGNSWEKPYGTVFHEFGHNIDNLMGAKESYRAAKFSATYKQGVFQKTINEEIADHISQIDKTLKVEFKKHSTDIDWLKANGHWGYPDEWRIKQGLPMEQKKYAKYMAYAEFKKELMTIPERARADLSDIVEGSTKTRIQTGFGHGKGYWKERPDGVASEAFAEFFNASMNNPESRAVLEKYLPKSAKIFDEMMDIIAKEDWS